METHKDLDVFKLAHQLALEIYKITSKFPIEERYGLSSQLRRSAYSVPMNIAEGGSRLNRKEYKQFIGISRSSAAEVMYQLLLAKDLQYISEDIYKRLDYNYKRIIQMLTKLYKSLSN